MACPTCEFIGHPRIMGYAKALERAVELRNMNPSVFTWRTISYVMAMYHGFDREESWWRKELVATGVVDARPRGVPFGENLVAA
jgi:hypothetical protein